MPDPLDFEKRPAFRRLLNARRLTEISMIAERLTVCLWRLATWAGFFAGLWMLRIPDFFGNAGAVISFITFSAGVIFFTWKDVLKFRFPERKDIDRRIEKASAFKYRPLDGLNDALANPSKSVTRQLWHENRQKIFNLLQAVRAARPRPLLAAQDPYALRLGVLIFFILGFFISGAQWDERISAGLRPFTFEKSPIAADKIVLWVTPPEYTGLQPIIIKGKSNDTLKIPENSTIKISLRGGFGEPKLVTEHSETPFTRSEGGNFTIEKIIPKGTLIKIRQGFFTRARWNYSIIADSAPQIAIQGKHEVMPDGLFRFPLEVTDDYGVKTLNFNLQLGQTRREPPVGATVNESRSVASPAGEAFAFQPVYDLTSHPWAGMPVLITFSVEDGKGQRVALSPLAVVLPERIFKHPVARAMIALRKKLINAPLADYEPLFLALEELMIHPRAYQDDIVVFLALRSASSRLYWSGPSRETASAVSSLLWDTALRVEGGEINIAARNLREAQQALEKALQNPEVTDAEIQKLMNDLRSAMAEYFMELQREIQKRIASGESMPIMPPEMMAQNIDAEALANFIDQMEAKMLEGDKKSAQEMLSQLHRLLDMMNPSMSMQIPQDMQMMREGVSALQELIRQQRALLDETRGLQKSSNALGDIHRGFGTYLPENKNILGQWKLEGMPPPPRPPEPDEPAPVRIDTGQQAAGQESIRDALGKLMIEAAEKMDSVPENLGLAEQEMRDSSAALKKSDTGLSIQHQQQALAYLEQAQQSMNQQLMERLQQMMGMALTGSGMRFDPLGRPFGGDGSRNGMFPGSPVKIPDEAERKKSQEILKLLRRRSSELERPETELDYYRRLLRQF